MTPEERFAKFEAIGQIALDESDPKIGLIIALCALKLLLSDKDCPGLGEYVQFSEMMRKLHERFSEPVEEIHRKKNDDEYRPFMEQARNLLKERGLYEESKLPES